ncbi:MAG: DUF6443 domain-containing protein, partial [Fluviicola sp.]
MKTTLKMNFTKIVRIVPVLSFLFVLALPNHLRAADERSINSATATATTSFWVYDAKYSDMMLNPSTWQNSYTNKKVTNLVRLSPIAGLSADFEVKVNVTVESKIWNNSLLTFSPSFTTTDLIIKASTNGTTTINDKQALVLSDALAMKVTINSVTFLSGSTATSNLILTSEILTDRQYFINSSAVTGLGHNPSSPAAILTASELDLSWDYKAGAEWYELEYVHVSKLGEGTNILLASNLVYNYYRNSTRVEVKGNHYRIPKVYDKGFVVYRVRAIGFNGATYSNRFESDWTAAETGLISAHPAANVIDINSDYDAQMNWSHTVTFAEDGKRSDALGYADGMGRGRQSIASNNATNQVIVSNVYYDEMGRPAVSDLPTPVDHNLLNHQPNFNRADDGSNTTFNYTVFDASSAECSVVPNAFSTSYGAGKYYSTNNPDKEGANAGIPDAEGFPYERITYKKDLLNRVDKEGSAGSTLKTHGGKETRYMDLSSEQEELNLLFGSDIGWADHYQKSAVIDQNGQAMISYTDMAGRTVATYLMGPTPVSLDALPENIVTTATTSLVSSGVGDVDNPSVPSSTLSHTILVMNSGNYTFNYGFTPQEYSKVCGSESICLDCVYDFNMKIVDECGTIYFNKTKTISGENLDAACTTETFSTDTTVFLTNMIGANIGVNYFITKNLSVNVDAVDDYWCYYLEVACIDEVPDIFNELYDGAEFTDCVPPLPGTSETGPCDVYKTIMMADMSPGGQYAAYTLNGTTYTYTDPVSILNLAGTGTKYNTVTYLDHLGAPITVVNDAGATVSPAALSQTEFIEKFQPEWALSLLELHPEYCFYSNCLAANTPASVAFDEAMMNTNSFQDAYDAGYFNPVPGGSIESILTHFTGAASTTDPYFTANPGAITDMINSMDPYSGNFSIWDYAALLAIPCTDPTPSNCLRDKHIEPCSLDYLWIEFRRMYLELKQQIMFQHPAEVCDDNCAIGVSGTYAGKQRRWPCWDDLLAGNPDLSDPALDYSNAIAAMCDETCAEYADEWLLKLAGCSISPSHLTALRQDLIDLCKDGCSASNPQGFASDMSGNTINSILSSPPYNIPETEICTELLISEPGLYQSPEELFEEVEAPLDVCGCDVIMQAEADLTAYLATSPSPILYHTVEEMLAHNTGISIEEVDPLLCACDKIKNGLTEYTWEAGNAATQAALDTFHYHIPEALSCEDGNCPDCETIGAAMEDLDERFPDLSGSPYYATITTNYLNTLYNQNYTYFQYLDFFAMCNATPSAPFCSENPATQGFLDMMTLLAYRGQFTSASPIDLLANNAVYEHGTISDYLPAPGTADYSFSLAGTTATLTFGAGSEQCTATILNPTNIDYSSILSFDLIGNDSPGCSSEPSYSLLVTYLDCGQTKTGLLSISSDCFNFYNCICNNANITLCDVPAVLPEEYCYTNLLSELYHATMDTYEATIAAEYEKFKTEYLAKCASAFTSENLSYTGASNNYQYTLFYYDQAGNLVRTVAPQGINMLPPSQNAAVNYAREHANDLPTPAPRVIPTHTFETYYTYNSFDQVENTSNPDQVGSTVFFYDFYGRSVASQDPEQAALNQYSYVLYDAQGRPVESGQINRTPYVGPMIALLSDAILKVDDLGAAFKSWVYSGKLSEVTITTYDKPLSAGIAAKFKSGTQQNLRLRVASVAYFETIPQSLPLNFYSTGFTSAIHYSYDIHGNVLEQLQDFPELAPQLQDVKSTQYDFELISGNVHKVTYQAGEADQFIHTYDYDAVNRLTEASTSPDGYTYSREAHYLYYDYGPLARKEIGDLKVQAEDFTYTINGWLKVKNATQLNSLHDAGKDGRIGYETANTTGHLNIPSDVTGYTLGYFEGDYKPIGGGTMETTTAGSGFSTNAANLYNGNIRLTTTAIKNVQVGSPGVNQVIGASYRYDQLNRLKNMKAYFGSVLDNGTATNWNAATATSSYGSSYAYNRNGSITSLIRYASSPSTAVDLLTYNYTANTNKLHKVTEAAGAAAFDDISNTQLNDNYKYNSIGQLRQDVAEGITTDINWRKGDGKMRQMVKNTNVTTYIYDPFGRRIAKIYKPGGTATKSLWVYTYYTNDANGTTMAVYDVKYATNYVNLKEQHIYGGERLGMVQLDKAVYANGTALPTTNLSTNTLGLKRYELVNHLGNVNAVITDRKVLDNTYSSLGHYFDFTSAGQTGWTT